MPQVKLIFGKQDLESDACAKGDAVLAMLYNGYRVGGSLYQIPALEELCDLGSGNVPVFCWYSTLHSVLYAFTAGKLYRVSKSGSIVEITGATLDADAQPSFTQDADNVFVAANSAIYKISGDTATAVGGQSPVDVKCLDYIAGFIVADGRDPLDDLVPGDVWYSDDKANGYQTWEVFNNEASPDGVQAIVASANEVYAVGRETLEVSQLSTDAANPFIAYKALSQPFGTPAPYTVAWDRQNIYYLTTIGENRVICRMVNCRTPQIISFPVDVPLNDISDVTDARATIVGFRGQTFYVITFPAAEVTIDDQVHSGLTMAFNIRAQAEEWYLWGEWIDQLGAYAEWPVNTVTYIEEWTKHVCGGNDGKIYLLDTAARETEPVLLHRWRNDGRGVWSNPRRISLGTVGDTTCIKRSYCCGQYTKRQDEFIFSDGPWRTAIRTGWRNWGKNQIKSSASYTYDIKRGEGGFVLNSIEEDIKVTK